MPPENLSRPALLWAPKGLWCASLLEGPSGVTGSPISCSNRSHCLKQTLTLSSPEKQILKDPKASNREVRACQRDAGVLPAPTTSPHLSKDLTRIFINNRSDSHPFLLRFPCRPLSSASVLFEGPALLHLTPLNAIRTPKLKRSESRHVSLVRRAWGGGWHRGRSKDSARPNIC